MRYDGDVAYVDLHCHIVFATKNRHAWIERPWRPRVHEYMGGTLRGLGASPLSIGGVADHVHLLVGMGATQNVADLVRELKKASGAFVRQTIGLGEFRWQEGYAAFSVSAEARPAVAGYISSQESHHRKESSNEELRRLLSEAGVSFDLAFLE